MRDAVFALYFQSTSSVFNEFKDFLMVDLNLTEVSAKEHCRHIHKFFNECNEEVVTKKTIRSFLLNIKQTREPGTYRNNLASLKRFFRDFLNKPQLVDTFRFPSTPFKPKTIPRDLKKFCENIDSPFEKALFLVIASSGLRRGEALSLEWSDIDFKTRIVIPRKRYNISKHVWCTLINNEALEALNNLKHSNPRIFYAVKLRTLRYHWNNISKKVGIKITPKILRLWFCVKMAELGVPDRYVDCLCGRIPRSVIARHYTDYSPERLKRIYDKANLRVLS